MLTSGWFHAAPSLLNIGTTTLRVALDISPKSYATGALNRVVAGWLLPQTRRLASRMCMAHIMALALLGFSAISAHAQPQTLRVISDDNYPPYLFRDASGNLEGYQMDIWKRWEQETGIKVELIATHWDQAQQALLNGDADVIDMMFRTPDRDATYDFSQPYANLPVAIYSHASIPGIASAHDLRGFLIGVQAGDACIERLRADSVTNFKLYPDYTSLIKGALDEQVKLFCMDEYPANYYLYKLDPTQKYRKAFQLYQGQFHYAVKKGATDTLQLIESGMARIPREDKIEMFQKWVGQSPVLLPYSRYIAPALGLLSLVGAIVLLWIFLLRRSVKTKTAELANQHQRLQQIIDGTAAGTWEWDIRSGDCIVNPRWAEMLGYTPDELEPCTADSCRALCHPDDLEQLVQALEAHLRGETDYFASESRRRHKNGHWIWVADRGRVTRRSSQGEALTMSGTRLEITKLKLAETTLKQAVEQQKMFIQQAPICVAMFDRDMRYLACSNQWQEEFGHQQGSLLGLNHYDVHPDIPEKWRLAHQRALAGERLEEEEDLWIRADGQHLWTRWMITPWMDDSQTIQGIIISSENISARKQAEEELRLAHTVFEHSSEAMLVTDADNNIITINPAFSEMTGYSLEEVIGKNPKILSSGRQGKEFYQELWNTLETSGEWRGEIWNRRKSGEEYAEWLAINNIYGEDGKLFRRVALFSDITEKKRADALIWNQANYDLLTQLPNRRLFSDRLQQEIKKSQHDHSQFALLFIDLDRFKEVNDTLGHSHGDYLLIEASHRIQRHLKETDTVGRLGGDEFTVIIANLPDPSVMTLIAQRVLDALAAPYDLEGEIVYLSASIGITVFPEDATTSAELLKNADQAMYEAKKNGRNRFSFFTPMMQAMAQARMRMMRDLRNALGLNQFTVYFQPIVDLSSQRIYKAEALIRWQHPELGFISPAEFIPLAEETGLIHEIGDWVFQQSAQLVKQCIPIVGDDFQVSVNKSPVQFRDRAHSHHDWMEYLSGLGLSGHNIVVEITEGLLLNADSGISDKLLHFRDAGMQVAIDDFGTGYSSLSYLKKFDIDYLKIDQSFVRNLSGEGEDLALCEAIATMAHKLDLRVIAEGVETTAQRDLLAQIGCDYGQGYLFSRPVPADEFMLLLERSAA
ncbi:diguanylate cyclase/phosphodiesterase with PAS/PAC sensor(s) [Methylovorus sp. MP688]|nr:diguanylate cyclase/phosphodiesterase with PAS/PAC sensor(s) [Methylovorus sp. MP688]